VERGLTVRGVTLIPADEHSALKPVWKGVSSKVHQRGEIAKLNSISFTKIKRNLVDTEAIESGGNVHEKEPVINYTAPICSSPHRMEHPQLHKAHKSRRHKGTRKP